jgi:hypothetical protein
MRFAGCCSESHAAMIQYGFEAQPGERRVPFRAVLFESAAGICVKSFQVDCC